MRYINHHIVIIHRTLRPRKDMVINMEIKGYVNSIQTLGTLDGPGVRFIVFMQGCNLRCGCCHNPETWALNTSDQYTPQEIVSKAERYREYFGEKGGITVSGGEPLLQANFVKEVFKLCKQKGINTCLDTSGSIINEDVSSLLEYTDYVLLDMKYTNNELYQKYVGCSIDKPLQFLKLLNEKRIKVFLRQVIIPTLNNTEQNITELKTISEKFDCVKKIELLPFKKLCHTKYEKLDLPFGFADIEEPSTEEMKRLNKLL